MLVYQMLVAHPLMCFFALYLIAITCIISRIVIVMEDANQPENPTLELTESEFKEYLQNWLTANQQAQSESDIEMERRLR